MFALAGALLLAVLVVGTATLSGHPIEVIATALLVAAVILAVMWRVRTLSGARDGRRARDD
ncbi:hypothetical protein HC031_22755 [Planosporangium thailandense]|uniref:Uncharacterized protein n=1 Tax=Planosporangium thailandense TaxID=765197 RepID=A0ABX0Y2C9_9ACTN|nr:hypothetical protein [Planosporangium thailandense]NJC72516.1 hypothetical protein [Planosporangium thailandense]